MERAGARAGKSRGTCLLLLDCSILNSLLKSGFIFRACFACLPEEGDACIHGVCKIQSCSIPSLPP